MKYNCDVLPVISDIKSKGDDWKQQPTIQQRVLRLTYMNDIITQWSTKWCGVMGVGNVFEIMREYDTIKAQDPEAWEMYCRFYHLRLAHKAIEIYY